MGRVLLGGFVGGFLGGSFVVGRKGSADRARVDHSLDRERFEQKMRLCLAMPTADGGERRFKLKSQRMVLGRDTRCDLRVSVPSVAMRHCEIVLESGVLRVYDLGSDGGTLHNGARVAQAILAPNDELTVGSVKFVIRTEIDGWAPGPTGGKSKTDPPARQAGTKERPGGHNAGGSLREVKPNALDGASPKSSPNAGEKDRRDG